MHPPALAGALPPGGDLGGKIGCVDQQFFLYKSIGQPRGRAERWYETRAAHRTERARDASIPAEHGARIPQEVNAPEAAK